MPETIHDPVCGREIDPDTAAASWMYETTIYYFCSQECREKFEATPHAYIKSGGASPAPKEIHHGAH